MPIPQSHIFLPSVLISNRKVLAINIRIGIRQQPQQHRNPTSFLHNLLPLSLSSDAVAVDAAAASLSSTSGRRQEQATSHNAIMVVIFHSLPCWFCDFKS